MSPSRLFEGSKARLIKKRRSGDVTNYFGRLHLDYTQIVRTMTPSDQTWWRRIIRWPSTRLGWWSAALAAANIVLVLAWSILPGGALLGFICGLVGGVLALLAVMRQHERSWLVFLSILSLCWVLLFVLGEFLVPH